MSTITCARLKELLDYDPHTGLFHWKQYRRGRGGLRCPGDVAGYERKSGYVSIRLDGADHLAHRLAWLYVNGSFPTQGIDHRDGVRSNNCFSNLREVTPEENQHNRHFASKSCKSGILGAWASSKKDGKFRSAIKVGVNIVHLGYFDSKEEAGAAYQKAKLQMHKGFAP